jgi:hypothetical protein
LKISAFTDVARSKSKEVPDSPFEAMFNPQTLTQTYSIRFDPGKGLGGTEQSATISDTNLVGTPEQTVPDRNAPAATPKYLRSNDMVSQAALADMVTQEVKGRATASTPPGCSTWR